MQLCKHSNKALEFLVFFEAIFTAVKLHTKCCFCSHETSNYPLYMATTTTCYVLHIDDAPKTQHTLTQTQSHNEVKKLTK